MKAPLYTEILVICQSMAQASTSGDEAANLAAHQALQKLCQSNQGTAKDHPLQWEALADFTHDGDQALDIYQLALHSAQKLNLTANIASIYLAIAQRYGEFEEPDKALEFANKANDLLPELTNDELKNEISEFLATLK
jgi:hypothetical protein